jgi:hypothetical protein
MGTIRGAAANNIRGDPIISNEGLGTLSGFALIIMNEADKKLVRKKDSYGEKEGERERKTSLVL